MSSNGKARGETLLEPSLNHLVTEVRHAIPSLHVAIQHGRNDSFPWWIVARFRKGADDAKVIDVSIDCRAITDGWSVQANIAREDGYVLRELGPIEGPWLANRVLPTVLTEELAAKVGGFLIPAAQEIAAELE